MPRGRVPGVSPRGCEGRRRALSGTRRRARLSRTARRRAQPPAARSRRRHGGEDAAGPSCRLPRRERGAFRGVSAGRSQRETRRSSSSLSSLLRRSTCHGLKNLIYLLLFFFFKLSVSLVESRLHEGRDPGPFSPLFLKHPDPSLTNEQLRA